MKNILIISTALFITSCNENKLGPSKLLGQTLPSFSILLPDSTTWFNTANLESGKSHVIFFFSPNCPYCKAQMNEIVENIDLLKSVRFLIVTNYSFGEMKEFYKKYNLSKFPNVTAGMDTAGVVMTYYESAVVPFNAIYGPDLKLKATMLGKVDYTAILKAIN